MISSIAKIGNNNVTKNLFSTDSDYYLYIIEYSDFDYKHAGNYSSDWHSSEITRILNNYRYDFTNRSIKKLVSKTFHSDRIMSFRYIFDIENLNFEETRPARITPAFLFTTVLPVHLNRIDFVDISNEIFIFLKIKPKDRDVNRIPQLVNEILSNIGVTITRCRRSNISSDYENVHFFDYCPLDTNNEILLERIKEDTTAIRKNHETLEKAIVAITNEQTEKIVNEIIAWITTATVELNNELTDKLEEIKKADSMQMKLKLSIPFIKLLGINFETEFDVKSWTKKMYNKYGFEIFKLMGTYTHSKKEPENSGFIR